MTSGTLSRYGGRMRERDLFLLVAVPCTKARERIREVLEWRVIVTLYHRPLVGESLRWWGYAFLTISMTICRTTLLRDSAPSGRSNRSCESMTLRTGRGCAAPPSPTAANTFESTFGGTLGRLVTAWCAKHETKLVRLVHPQESTFSPAPGKCIGAAATPDSDFSLRIEVARPTSSSSQHGPTEPRTAIPAEYPETDPELILFSIW